MRQAFARLSRSVVTLSQIAGVRIRCRFQVAASVLSVVAENNIAQMVRHSKGFYTVTSGYLFPTDNTFAFSWNCINDLLQEVSRTAQSVSFKTVSGDDITMADVSMEIVNIYDSGTGTPVLTSPWIMTGFGSIDGNTVGQFTPASPSVGTSDALNPFPLYIVAGNPGVGVYKGALAYADAGVPATSIAIVFTYQTETSVAGGVMLGCRWDNGVGVGVFAHIMIASGTVLIELVELSGGAWAGVQTQRSGALALTSGNPYTLTLADAGTGLTASLVDDTTGTISVSITTSNNNTKTQIAYGWIDQDLGNSVTYLSTISAEPT